MSHNLERRTRERNFRIFRLRGLIASVDILVTNQPRKAVIIDYLLSEINYIKKEQQSDARRNRKNPQ